MVGKTHSAVGTAIYIAIKGFDPAGIAVAYLSSRIPDIDLKIKVLKHRGPTHSIFMTFLLLLCIFKYFPSILLPVAVGVLSHIFLDALTPAGVSLFWPFFRGRIRIPIALTGGISDKFCRWTAIVFIIFFLFKETIKVFC